MRYLSYADPELTQYPVVLLVPSIRKDDIRKHYLDNFDLKAEELLVIQIHATPDKKKTPAAEIKAWITEELGPALLDIKTEYLLVADAEYFKVLAKVSKVDPHLGYVMDCAYGPWKVIYVPNYQAVFYDPEKVTAKITMGMEALLDDRMGIYTDPGNNIIRFANYPQSDWDVQQWLNKLLEHPVLSADIEAFSLKHYDAGIGTITLCWNQSEGIAFPVDYVSHPERQPDGNYGFQQDNPIRKAMLRDFFIRYRAKGHKLMWHSIGYDVGVLIYQLFMDHLLDQEGLLYGMDILLGDHGEWDCTKLITYLATNSCAGNKLGLKDQAQEYAGNYAMEEIRDIRRIPLATLLQYNLVDGLSTWYVYNKHWPTLVADQQLPVYRELFQPAMVDIIQMQLTGMPINMAQVLEVDELLTAIESQAVDTIRASRVVQHYTHVLRIAHVDKRNSELKKKQITLADAEVDNVIFNPNSAPQLQDLLFEELQLPVLALTDTKLPATDGDTLKALQNHTKDPDVLEFLSALVDYKAVNKIISDFIPSLKNAQQGPDGWHYLFGNFNLGGTKSGRLSSSGPNLQNLPANVVMALAAVILQMFAERLAPYVKGNKLSLGKLIKSCFEAPPGWVFAGLDFDSLEDRISALTTKDPNKLRVYTDGFDGHCLRAFSYFGDGMQGIDPNNVNSINSIAKLYPTERQDSKAPTFALTYQGTWSTLVKNCGFSEEKARSIETKYHELYHVSDAWVSDKLDEASKVGYVTLAFGLRLRTPLLAQVIRGNSKTPHAAEAEGRTAGNALGQSYCLLNSRAGSEFMSKVRKSVHRLFIKPCAQIHDAGYFLIRDDIEAISYANEHLVSAVQWQASPEIYHDEVKLGGSLGLFHPNWTTEITLPNGASEEDILNVIEEHLTLTQMKAGSA
jgi:DNA polymerase-1